MFDLELAFVWQLYYWRLQLIIAGLVLLLLGVFIFGPLLMAVIFLFFCVLLCSLWIMGSAFHSRSLVGIVNLSGSLVLWKLNRRRGIKTYLQKERRKKGKAQRILLGVEGEKRPWNYLWRSSSLCPNAKAARDLDFVGSKVAIHYARVLARPGLWAACVGNDGLMPFCMIAFHLLCCYMILDCLSIL